jgi:signal transduction histidine kinase
MTQKRRILIVDDTKSIHEDFKKTLISPVEDDKFNQIEQILFQKKQNKKGIAYQYIIDDAYQGEEAIEMVHKAEKEGFPYSLIFMDVRMPPGIDGVETIDRIWQTYPNIEMVICSAYSDYSWDEILEKFGQTDRLLFVKKPFNIIVIKQLALSLITKWDIAKKNREYMKLLEKEVEERTKELRHLLEEMKVLKEKAEDASRQKSAFLSNMSHEIRSPMNSILGFTDLLTESDLPREVRLKYLSYISSSGNSLLNLINDIIYNAKIEAGVLSIEPEEFDLNSLLREIEDKMNLEKSNKNKDSINLELILPENGDMKIIADPERLRQIIINLLTNAIKFTLEGFVTFGYLIEHNEWLKFYVKDTGIGIHPDKIDTIFERFGQVDDERIKNSKGTGLGLSISKNLVELMGGKIWVESEPDKGSTFYFTIPFNPAQIKKDTRQTTEKSTKEVHGISSDTLILIAEDEEFNWIFLQQVLEHTGAKLIWMKNGKEAVDYIARGEKTDLVLMDIKMPEMDGIEATQQIKKIKPGIPVIAQTAFALSEDEKKFRAQGFDDYITKPIDIKLLLEKLNFWLTNNTK